MPRETDTTTGLGYEPVRQDVARDGAEKFSVRIDRDNFAGSVDVELKNLPAGVSVPTPEERMPAGKRSLDVTVKASPETKIVRGTRCKSSFGPKARRA